MEKMFRFFTICIATASIGRLCDLAVFLAVLTGNALLRCSRPLRLPENETNPRLRNIKNQADFRTAKTLSRPVARNGVQCRPRHNLFNGGIKTGVIQ